MSAPTPPADELLDYPFLLVTHIVCVDRNIHKEESKALRKLAKRIRVGDRTSDEMEKIFRRESRQLSVEEVAQMVPSAQRRAVMRQILAIAYIDGYFSSLERELIDKVAQIWNWNERELQRLLETAKANEANRSLSDNNDQP